MVHIETAVIRQFLLERFSAEELRQLCFDYFIDVYHEFTDSMRKSQMVQLLLEHCQAQERMPALIAAIERERPQAISTFITNSPQVDVPVTQSVKLSDRNPQQIFISYAHQDTKFAHQLADDLSRRNYQVWIAPNSVQPGEKWIEAINRGLAESGIFLLLLTENAVNSRWVQNETHVAIELNNEDKLHFVPLQVEQCEIPPIWRVYQRIPIQTDYKAGFDALLRHLDSITTDKEMDWTKDKAPPKSELLFNFPTWAWFSGLSLVIFIGIFILLQTIPFFPTETPTPTDAADSNPTSTQTNKLSPSETAVSTPTIGTDESADELDIDGIKMYPGFFGDRTFQGEIKLGQTVSVERKPPGMNSDTWLFRDGPATVDIILEGSENVNFLIRIYDKSSLNYDDVIPGGYVDFNKSGGGQELTFFEIPDDGNYVIAITGDRNIASTYQLTVVESVPEQISLNSTVEGSVTGPNPGVWLFNDGPATINITLEVGPRDRGLLMLFDEFNGQLGYIDTPDADGKLRLENILIPDESNYMIVVRDANNDGTQYTLTVEE